MKPLLALIPAVILAGLLAWKWTDAEGIRKDRDKLASEVAVLSSKVNSLEVKSQEAAKEIAKAREAAGTEASGAPGEKKKDKGPMADMSKAWMEVMSSDAGKEIMTYMSKMGVEGVYKDLLDLLDLPEDKRAALSSLLSQMKSAQDMQWMKFMNPNLSDEEKKKLVADIKASHEDFQKKIKEAMNDDAKFKQFEQYQDSEPERMSVGMLKGTLDSKGLPLSEQQEQQMLDVLYGQRKGMKWDHDYASQSDADPAKFTPEALSRYQTQVAEYDQKVGGQLNGVLNDQQMETFKTQRDGWRKFEQVWLNMASGFFAAKKE